MKYRWIFNIVVLLIFTVLQSSVAQVSPASTNKYTITLRGAQIQSAGGIVHVQDTLTVKLAVESVSVGGQSLWLKKAATVPTRAGVVHFYFDEATQQLTLRFSSSDVARWDDAIIEIVLVGVQGKIHPSISVRGGHGEILSINP